MEKLTAMFKKRAITAKGKLTGGRIKISVKLGN
ncbi:MAG: hypothetical protein ACJASG_000013 [Oleiphilaceae bacterium]